MGTYKKASEMTKEEWIAFRAKINARNKSNVDHKPEMIAARRLKKQEYKKNLKFTNPVAWAKVKASKHASRKRKRANGADGLHRQLFDEIAAASDSTEGEEMEEEE